MAIDKGKRETGPVVLAPDGPDGPASGDITFGCSKCSRTLVIDAKGAGLAVQCPDCKAWLQVPMSGTVGFDVEEVGTESAPDAAAPAAVQPAEQGSWLQKCMPWLRNKSAPPPQDDPVYRENIAKAVSTSPETLENILARGRSDNVARLAAQNPRCPPDVIQELVEAALSSNKRGDIALYALRNPACPVSVLVSVVRRKILDPFTREALLHQNMPAAVLTEVAQEGDDELRNLIVGNPACPAEIINELAVGDRKKPATIKAIHSPKCSEETLIRVLAAFENDAASFAVLKNPGCSAKIIHAILLRDEDDELSAAAAGHGKCSPETRNMVLGRKRKDRVSMAMARSSYCPKDLKKKWMDETGQMPKTEEDKAAEKKKKEMDDDLNNMRPTGM